MASIWTTLLIQTTYKGGEKETVKHNNISLHMFKELVLAACQDGDYSLSIAPLAMLRELTPDEIVEALRYAAYENVTLHFESDVVFSDGHAYEQDEAHL